MAYRFLIIYFIALSLIACNNNEAASPYDEMLSTPPYRSLTDSIHHDSKNAQLYYSRGLLLRKNNAPAAALSDFNTAWKLNKKEEYAVAISAVLISKPDSGISFIKTALNDFPQSIPLQLNLIQSYQSAGDTDNALKTCDEITSQHPNQLDALQMKAEMLKNRNDVDGSIKILEHAYNIAPLDEEVAFNLAYMYAQTNNPKVLALCDSLIAHNSKKAEPYYFPGVYYENMGQNEKAIHFFDQAIAHDYTFIDAYMEKGQIYYDDKKYAEALKIFNLVLRLSNSYADGYFWLAKSQEALGQKQDALLNYQRAYGLDKTLIEAKEAIERLNRQ